MKLDPSEHTFFPPDRSINVDIVWVAQCNAPSVLIECDRREGIHRIDVDGLENGLGTGEDDCCIAGDVCLWRRLEGRKRLPRSEGEIWWWPYNNAKAVPMRSAYGLSLGLGTAGEDSSHMEDQRVKGFQPVVFMLSLRSVKRTKEYGVLEIQYHLCRTGCRSGEPNALEVLMVMVSVEIARAAVEVTCWRVQKERREAPRREVFGEATTFGGVGTSGTSRHTRLPCLVLLPRSSPCYK